MSCEGIDVDLVDNDGKTPLYFASQEGNVDVANALLCHGASPDGVDTPAEKRSAFPLFIAAQQGERAATATHPPTTTTSTTTTTTAAAATTTATTTHHHQHHRHHHTPSPTPPSSSPLPPHTTTHHHHTASPPSHRISHPPHRPSCTDTRATSRRSPRRCRSTAARWSRAQPPEARLWRVSPSHRCVGRTRKHRQDACGRRRFHRPHDPWGVDVHAHGSPRWSPRHCSLPLRASSACRFCCHLPQTQKLVGPSLVWQGLECQRWQWRAQQRQRQRQCKGIRGFVSVHSSHEQAAGGKASAPSPSCDTTAHCGWLWTRRRG
jgi:hypothetical protein